MSPVPRRLKQDDLPPILADQLMIENTKLTWKGRILSQAQKDALDALIGDPPFVEAIGSIISELQTKRVDGLELDLPARPLTEDLNDALEQKLLLGRSLLRFHGLMTLEEGKALLEQYELAPDKSAISMLHESTMQKGLENREIKVRARRGNATPSDLIEIKTKNLQVEGTNG